MKNVRLTVLTILMAFGSLGLLSGCFVDADEEIFDTLDTTEEAENASNDDQWL